MCQLGQTVKEMDFQKILFMDMCRVMIGDPDNWRNGLWLEEELKLVWLKHQQEVMFCTGINSNELVGLWMDDSVKMAYFEFLKADLQT